MRDAIEVDTSSSASAAFLRARSRSAAEVDSADYDKQPDRLDDIDLASVEEFSAGHDAIKDTDKLAGRLCIVEDRRLFRECLQRSIQSVLPLPSEALSSLSELENLHGRGLARLSLISMTRQNAADIQRTLGRLPDLTSDAPVVILSADPEFDAMRAAIGYGAKGYIPMTMRFEIAIEALHIVLAGGTYVPAECILTAASSSGKPSSSLAAPGAVTARELAVARAVHLGKTNKVIARELNMRESTVKVHVRHIMKKLCAKNRTEVAIKSTGLLSGQGQITDANLAVAVSSGLSGNKGGEFHVVAAGRDRFDFAVIDKSAFMGGCIARAVAAAFPSKVGVFGSVDEFFKRRDVPSTALVIISSSTDEGEDVSSQLELIAAAGYRAIVIGSRNDPGAALFALGHRAKAYIPTTLGWDIAVEAMRIVLAGGAYIPVQYIVEMHNSAPSVSQRTIGAAGITQREMTVLRAIQLGKANKVIAKELDLSVSTVKVHVRHVMSKLQVRNRTELAVRAAGMHWADAPEPDSEANRPIQERSETRCYPASWSGGAVP